MDQIRKILPEQTLGRGLRRMFFGQDVEEYVSVIGTPAFMEFVESIKAEGVELEKRKMDRSGSPITPTVIEVDYQNTKKDIENLDIELAGFNSKNTKRVQKSKFIEYCRI
jgi:type III restriction enzyme